MRNYRTFFAICKALGKTKEEAVLEFTDGRTDSLSSLDDGEFKELMVCLRRLQPVPDDWEPKPGDNIRKKMIGLAQTMRWGKSLNRLLDRLDEWCLNHTKYKKALNELTIDELTKVCTILETKVYPDYLKGLKNDQ